MFNEFYARDTSKKIRAVKKAKAERGERVNGQSPYGYIIDPEDKNHLLPDPETAYVVRKIFAMYVHGDRICEIQDWLRNNEIVTVAELQYQRTGCSRHPRPRPDCRCNWPDKTLYDILTRKEYLGHTYTGKSYKVSYKSKKTKRVPEEQQHFFPNTHEPLIDQETFDLAQKRIATKHRPTKNEEIDIFSGLLFCADCGYKLTLQSCCCLLVIGWDGRFSNHKGSLSQRVEKASHTLFPVCQAFFTKKMPSRHIFCDGRVLLSYLPDIGPPGGKFF